MKKAITILLVFCVLTYIGGYQIFYACYQAGLKSEMRSYLQKNKLAHYGTHLKLASKNGQIKDPRFRWEEEGTEFRYDNELYDIVTIDIQDGYSVICCLKDDSENQLEKQLDEIKKTEKKTASSSASTQIKFFSVFCTIETKWAIHFFGKSIAAQPFFAHSILSRSSEILSPPPQY